MTNKDKSIPNGKNPTDEYVDPMINLANFADDDGFWQTLDYTLTRDEISMSELQRKQRIGYGRAASYIDCMSSLGIISGPNGERPRQVLMTKEEYLRVFCNHAKQDTAEYRAPALSLLYDCEAGVAGLRDMLACEGLNGAPATAVCLGRDESGAPVCADIARLPHLLIAGMAESGKTSLLYSVMTQLLYRATPDELRIIFISGEKEKSASLFSPAPQLLLPVITDSAQAIGALSWATEEMERRFERFSRLGVYRLSDYNELASNNRDEPNLYSIVIFIDGLSSLFGEYNKDFETYICRIAQKARAVGIHLVISTELAPSERIPAAIKMNIPSRIALRVASATDSRAILDEKGAEKLCLDGEMLFHPISADKPTRLRGACVRYGELLKLSTFWRVRHTVFGRDRAIEEEINEIAEGVSAKKEKMSKPRSKQAARGDEDSALNEPDFIRALELVLESQSVSTAFLQRKLRIGYGKTARYLDIMFEMGIIADHNGQKPRKVLMTKEEYNNKISKGDK